MSSFSSNVKVLVEDIGSGAIVEDVEGSVVEKDEDFAMEIGFKVGEYGHQILPPFAPGALNLYTFQNYIYF